MDTANDGSLNRHGGQADMESNADEEARERSEAVEERMREMLTTSRPVGYSVLCPECDEAVVDWVTEHNRHIATCELLRARAEREVK